MKRAVIGILVLTSIGCGDMARQGTSAAYLRVEEILAASGAEPEDFGGVLSSDVHTVTNRDTGEAGIFSDTGRVSFQLGLKDPGPSCCPATPSPVNYITVNRYRVRYIRSDGRNTEGVDVPYSFDGAFTITVNTSMSAVFELVRAQAKSEAPLGALLHNNVVISTIAEVTFYGHDQTGREVITTANIGVNFANWGDPD